MAERVGSDRSYPPGYEPLVPPDELDVLVAEQWSMSLEFRDAWIREASFFRSAL